MGVGRGGGGGLGGGGGGGVGVGVVDCFERVPDTTFLAFEHSSMSARKSTL